MKDTICVAVGLVGGFFTAIFGGWDSALVTLVVFMAIDFFTGIITAMMKKSKHTESGGLSSKAGWFGLAKKVCTLMLIVVAVRMDILLNTNYIRDAVCISFCLNELLSIVENTSLMGIPYPPAIQKAIDVLQTKIGRTSIAFLIAGGYGIPIKLVFSTMESSSFRQKLMQTASRM